ncbi:MAG: M20/M25/M40 family metallo-hydrolase [Spirochaetales bacterium]|nr:M20/M25/M40 family metallo-hydrolase [Spirochaetales bacterium]
MTGREERYAKILSEMIRVETISEPGVVHEAKFIKSEEVLARLFPKVFSTFERLPVEHGLLLRLKGRTDGEAVLLMSHQDVVSAEGEWKHPPFSGEIAEGKVWGRGTVDTKGALMCILQAAEELLEERYTPEVDFYIASSWNEEVTGTGAVNTAKYLHDHGVRLQLLMDEGGMVVEEPVKGIKGRFAMIGTVEKGYGDIVAIAHGKGGHASAPPKNSPLARLAAFVHEIETNDPNTAELSPTLLEMFRRMGSKADGALGFVLRNARFLKPLLRRILPKRSPVLAAMMKTTMAFTMAEGSLGRNVLPQVAKVNINTRFIQHQGVDKTMELLSPIAKKHEIELKIEGNRSDLQLPVDFTGKAFRTVEETVKELFPDVVPTPYVMTGGTDAYHYRIVTDDAIRFAPLQIDNQQYASIHAADENIDVAVLPPAVDFYKAIIKKMR